VSDAPAWDRLRPPAGTALVVQPPRRLSASRLVIVDGDIVEAERATVIWAWRSGGYRLRAARIVRETAVTYEADASALEIHARDDALARLLGFEPDAPPPDVVWHWLEPPAGAMPAADPVCACKATPAEAVEAAIRRGWRTTDAVKRATKATFGACQGRLCSAGIAARAGVGPGSSLGRITPRPPLVPVPASILAAFAAAEES
jgi:hypothetical protein